MEHVAYMGGFCNKSWITPAVFEEVVAAALHADGHALQRASAATCQLGGPSK